MLWPLHPDGQFATFERLERDSHLAIAKPAYAIASDDDDALIRFFAETDDGRFELIGTPNRRGFLAQVTAEAVYGEDAQDARVKVSRALASSLSSITIHLDIPLFVYQADMIELKTGNRFISVISPFPERPMLIGPTATLSKEFLAYASLYREALNSNTPMFQFLCFFKIIEGIQERRKHLAVEAAAGITPSTPMQVIPSDEADFLRGNAIYHVGRDWDYITLLEHFRGRGARQEDQPGRRGLSPAHSGAHCAAVLDSGELTISADEDMDMRQAYKWLSLTKCIVRHLLKSDFPNELLEYLNDKGEVVSR